MKDTELKRKRDRDLYATYVRCLGERGFSSTDEAADYARMQQAPQFYISARSASLTIGRIMAHCSLIGMNATSRKRIWTLYDRYKAYLADHPGCTLSREVILEEIIDGTAPEYYISFDSARRIIINERRKARRQKTRR